MRMKFAPDSGSRLMSFFGAVASAVTDESEQIPRGTRGLVLVDKLGRHIRFLEPGTFKELANLEVGVNATHGHPISPDHTTAYFPVYGGRHLRPQSQPGTLSPSSISPRAG